MSNFGYHLEGTWNNIHFKIFGWFLETHFADTSSVSYLIENMQRKRAKLLGLEV